MTTNSTTTAATGSDASDDPHPDPANPPTGLPFDLLTQLTSDARTSDIWSARNTVEGWLRTESALAQAQAEMGLVPQAHADAIASAVNVNNIDFAALWRDAQVVGYPILPLVRQVDAILAPEHRGFLHLGATTQDIMDTGLSLQLVASTDRLIKLCVRIGDRIATLAEAHTETVMPGRTHAQQAVPTTFGAKLAVYLSDFARHLTGYRRLRDDLALVSMHGAGGTSAAYGAQASTIRKLVGQRLGLVSTDLPWHVSRVQIAEWGQRNAFVCATGARLAREVIDLARNEIGELTERTGHHRGASSTMPQKQNPITSESMVGTAIVADGLVAGLTRVIEAQHERAAGEWHAEWFLIPHLAGCAAASLIAADDLLDGLDVHADVMADNLEVDHGLIMAESYMIALASRLGREDAHDLVYAAAQRARANDEPLRQALEALAAPDDLAAIHSVRPAQYVGDPESVVDAGVDAWQASRQHQ